MQSVNALDLALGTGPVVKAVLALLLLASVLSWTVIFAKWFAFRAARRDTGKFLDMFWSAKSLDSIFNETKRFSSSHVSNVFRAGYLEFQKVSTKGSEIQVSNDVMVNTGVENVQRALRKASVFESLRLEKMVPVLATIASVCPFIGLFGTVWGIMTSFQGLAQGGSATLQRVAPGISEALIATAVGLAAAIPAVVAYNSYTNRLRTFRVDMDNFVADFTNILKRNYLK